MAEEQISTTALAKALQFSSQRLFTLLKDYQWIDRIDDHWRLTPTGERQGATYRQSDKFGEYIVWPVKLIDHPLLQAAADANFVTATAIGEHFQRSGRYVNRVLRELGWVRRDKDGWTPAELGVRHGGVQQQGKEGLTYVSWPKAITSEPALRDAFRKLNILRRQQEDSEPDLFADAQTTRFEGELAYRSLDGHVLQSAAQTEVCQWLYLMGFAHAHRRVLQGHQDLVCDFYLPEQGLCIDIWDVADSAHVLAERLAKKEWCQQNHLTLLELDQNDVADSDNVLSARLKEYGIPVY